MAAWPSTALLLAWAGAALVCGACVSAHAQGAPDDDVVEFGAICLDQPAGFAGAEAAARQRGWTEAPSGRPASRTYGVLFGRASPFRRLTYDLERRSGSRPSCMIVLHDPACERIRALADRVEARIGRPPTSWDDLNCEAIWRSPASTRVVVVGYDGHVFARLGAFEDIQTERAQ